MSNRSANPNATEKHILRGLQLQRQAYTANYAPAPCYRFAIDRDRYQAQTAPRIQFVDISSSLMATGNKRKSDSEAELEKKFRGYADKWYAETMRDSSISRMTSNINYLNVIKLGPAVVPFILRELQLDPAPWFLALRVLTEATDVGTGDGYAGNFEKIAKAWIRWGKERGLI